MAEPPVTPPTGFLEVSPGNSSAMRLMALLTLVASIVFGLITVLGKAGPDGITVTLAFLGMSFGGKFAQKALEVKAPPA